MWMIDTDYIQAIKCQLRDVYGFKPSDRSTDTEPVFDDIPDGEYHMTIEGRLDRVRIENGKINCCNFDKPEAVT